MTLNLDAVGTTSEPRTVSWTPDEAMLYAIGVGAGQDDPLAELAFTTENSHGVEQRVLPTFGVVLNQFRGGSRLNIGEFNPAMLVHAEQSVELSGALPATGSLEITSTVTGIYDKGSGALVVSEASGRVPGSEEALVVTRSSVFIRGEGGFGIPGPKDAWAQPERDPDVVLTASTREDQALLYRLSGDHNPLHTDPAFAARAGFPRPILHGMCTYGVVGRALLGALADGDPERFAGMSGRFSKPVFPGEALSIRVWQNEGPDQFQVVNDRDEIVLDRGTFALR
ncbi:enoyl-CoA hydratase [Planctomonas sp. JC2975]|uniref:MaoC/PaaZ C-terminal domain-containing protein n=1 Tax=Planctomonas sp. JC2975 TaxID=2729626 RepID=UPI00147555AA|nr:MaoC/PaaZ C-terminal domain-containing protein [Planctomonas sp. JC2975]NNC12060.1 enoyl-CoA hydratase [Planctomonas sp. JC2975]